MVKNIVMNVQWVKCTHPCRKIYLPERGIFYRAVKVMEFLAPTYSLLLKDKHIKFYKVRNSVTWSVQDAHVQCSNVQCSKMINFVFMAKSIILAQFCCQPRSQGREPGNKVVLLPEADRQRINVVLFLADCALSLSVLRRGSRWVHPLTKTMP